MTVPLRVDGVDISHHQSGTLNMTDTPVKFVYHKATEGATFIDQRYKDRREQARKAKMPFGAYHFARPALGDAAAEARHFLHVAAPRPGDLLPCLDLEVTEGLIPSALRQWAIRFSEIVKKEIGFLPVLYCPWDFNLPNIRWVPRYNNLNIPPTIPWDVWQFSNGAYGVPNQVRGFGHVDLNVFADGFRLGELRIPKPVRENTATIRIVTQNIKALPLMSQSKVVEDVMLTARQADIVGWQEIKPERYDDAIQALEESGKWETYWGQGRAKPGLIEKGDDREEEDYASPISWRAKRFRFVDGGKWLLHKATAGICADRWVTWVVLEETKTGARLYVDNAHYVSGAWSDNPKPHKEKRKEMWRDGYFRHVRFLAEKMKDHPSAAMFSLGDYNANRKRDAHLWVKEIRDRNVRSGVGPKSIDHIWFLNGRKWRVDPDDDGGELLGGRNSDHQGRRLQFTLKERRSA